MTAARRLLFRIAGGTSRIDAPRRWPGAEDHWPVAAYAYRWQAVYGSETSYIPIANLRGADWQDDARHVATNLTLRTDGGASVHAFARDNPSVESYAAFLSALPGVVQAATATWTASPPGVALASALDQ